MNEDSFQFEISSIKIEAEILSERLRADKSLGGIVVFEGRVRNHSDGKNVLKLEYEAYKALATQEGVKILQEAITRHPGIKRLVCVHREGELLPGELAVFVGAASAHRDEAFLSCRFVIEAVKHRLPIWKKETFESGEAHWVNCSEHQGAACN